MGCHALLQGIFPIQGLNLGFLHCRQMLYNLNHQGSPTFPVNLSQWGMNNVTKGTGKQVFWGNILEGGLAKR